HMGKRRSTEGARNHYWMVSLRVKRGRRWVKQSTERIPAAVHPLANESLPSANKPFAPPHQEL
ncbi:MAG TPA: hypothetical protein PK999_15345, partial [Nitrospira sp.]|nr:hypothetical protein [Nitrospira sp.]